MVRVGNTIGEVSLTARKNFPEACSKQRFDTKIAVALLRPEYRETSLGVADPELAEVAPSASDLLYLLVGGLGLRVMVVRRWSRVGDASFQLY